MDFDVNSNRVLGNILKGYDALALSTHIRPEISAFFTKVLEIPDAETITENSKEYFDNSSNNLINKMHIEINSDYLSASWINYNPSNNESLNGWICLKTGQDKLLNILDPYIDVPITITYNGMIYSDEFNDNADLISPISEIFNVRLYKLSTSVTASGFYLDSDGNLLNEEPTYQIDSRHRLGISFNEADRILGNILQGNSPLCLTTHIKPTLSAEFMNDQNYYKVLSSYINKSDNENFDLSVNSDYITVTLNNDGLYEVSVKGDDSLNVLLSLPSNYVDIPINVSVDKDFETLDLVKGLNIQEHLNTSEIFNVRLYKLSTSVTASGFYLDSDGNLLNEEPTYQIDSRHRLGISFNEADRILGNILQGNSPLCLTTHIKPTLSAEFMNDQNYYKVLSSYINKSDNENFDLSVNSDYITVTLNNDGLYEVSVKGDDSLNVLLSLPSNYVDIPINVSVDKDFETLDLVKGLNIQEHLNTSEIFNVRLYKLSISIIGDIYLSGVPNAILNEEPTYNSEYVNLRQDAKDALLENSVRVLGYILSGDNENDSYLSTHVRPELSTIFINDQNKFTDIKYFDNKSNNLTGLITLETDSPYLSIVSVNYNPSDNNSLSGWFKINTTNEIENIPLGSSAFIPISAFFNGQVQTDDLILEKSIIKDIDVSSNFYITVFAPPIPISIISIRYDLYLNGYPDNINIEIPTYNSKYYDVRDEIDYSGVDRVLGNILYSNDLCLSTHIRPEIEIKILNDSELHWSETFDRRFIDGSEIKLLGSTITLSTDSQYLIINEDDGNPSIDTSLKGWYSVSTNTNVINSLTNDFINFIDVPITISTSGIAVLKDNENVSGKFETSIISNIRIYNFQNTPLIKFMYPANYAIEGNSCYMQKYRETRANVYTYTDINEQTYSYIHDPVGAVWPHSPGSSQGTENIRYNANKNDDSPKNCIRILGYLLSYSNNIEGDFDTDTISGEQEKLKHMNNIRLLSATYILPFFYISQDNYQYLIEQVTPPGSEENTLEDLIIRRDKYSKGILSSDLSINVKSRNEKYLIIESESPNKLNGIDISVTGNPWPWFTLLLSGYDSSPIDYKEYNDDSLSDPLSSVPSNNYIDIPIDIIITGNITLSNNIIKKVNLIKTEYVRYVKGEMSFWDVWGTVHSFEVRERGKKYSDAQTEFIDFVNCPMVNRNEMRIYQPDGNPFTSSSGIIIVSNHKIVNKVDNDGNPIKDNVNYCYYKLFENCTFISSSLDNDPNWSNYRQSLIDDGVELSNIENLSSGQYFDDPVDCEYCLSSAILAACATWGIQENDLSEIIN